VSVSLLAVLELGVSQTRATVCKLTGLESQPSFLSLSRARGAVVCPRVSLLVLALAWQCLPSCLYMWPNVGVKRHQ
jgi:hypothetical protein